MIKRDWKDARRKVDSEGMCRVCGRSCELEAAHITGRVYDQPKPGQKTRWVNPDSIVPLCGQFSPEWSCHTLYDSKQLDLLGHLTPQEEAKAVLDLGSIESARRRLCPSAYSGATQ